MAHMCVTLVGKDCNKYTHLGFDTRGQPPVLKGLSHMYRA